MCTFCCCFSEDSCKSKIISILLIVFAYIVMNTIVLSPELLTHTKFKNAGNIIGISDNIYDNFQLLYDMGIIFDEDVYKTDSVNKYAKIDDRDVSFQPISENPDAIYMDKQCNSDPTIWICISNRLSKMAYYIKKIVSDNNIYQNIFSKHENQYSEGSELWLKMMLTLHKIEIRDNGSISLLVQCMFRPNEHCSEKLEHIIPIISLFNVSSIIHKKAMSKLLENNTELKKQLSDEYMLFDVHTVHDKLIQIASYYNCDNAMAYHYYIDLTTTSLIYDKHLYEKSDMDEYYIYILYSSSNVREYCNIFCDSPNSKHSYSLSSFVFSTVYEQTIFLKKMTSDCNIDTIVDIFYCILKIPMKLDIIRPDVNKNKKTIKEGEDKAHTNFKKDEYVFKIAKNIKSEKLRQSLIKDWYKYPKNNEKMLEYHSNNAFLTLVFMSITPIIFLTYIILMVLALKFPGSFCKIMIIMVIFTQTVSKIISSSEKNEIY